MCFRVGFVCVFVTLTEIAVSFPDASKRSHFPEKSLQLLAVELVPILNETALNKDEYQEGEGVSFVPMYKNYIHLNEKGSYSAADDLCFRNGSQLASIKNDEQYKLLSLLMEFYYKYDTNWLNKFWTSGNDLNHRGRFIWKYNGELIPLSKWWLKGNPNLKYGESEERCVELASGRYFQRRQSGIVLNDANCLQKNYPLCEEYYIWDDKLKKLIKLDINTYRQLKMNRHGHKVREVTDSDIRWMYRQ